MAHEIGIRTAQGLVDNWIHTYGVRYFNELTNMACLTEEVGELARIMARKYGEQSFKEGEDANLSDEMADVLWVLICLANQTGVDLSDALRRNIDKKTERDKDRHLSNPKLAQQPAQTKTETISETKAEATPEAQHAEDKTCNDIVKRTKIKWERLKK